MRVTNLAPAIATVPQGAADEDLRDEHLLSDALERWERPPETLEPVSTEGLPPLLRALLVEDGTVTNLLAALSGEHVVAQPVDGPIRGEAPDQPGPFSSFPADRVRSRHIVLQGATSGTCYCFASSVLMLGRLPASFPTVLRSTPPGIGAALQKMGLETRRDFLWQGCEREARVSDAYQPHFAEGALARCYRIVHAGRTVVVIRENFPMNLTIPGLPA